MRFVGVLKERYGKAKCIYEDTTETIRCFSMSNSGLARALRGMKQGLPTSQRRTEAHRTLDGLTLTGFGDLVGDAHRTWLKLSRAFHDVNSILISKSFPEPRHRVVSVAAVRTRDRRRRKMGARSRK